MLASEIKPTRTLRIRANVFRSALGPSTRGELRVPTREGVVAGDRVAIEISFGPLADEITLTGRVLEGPTRIAPSATVVLDPEQTAKLAYIGAVLDGGRQAAARRHRRLPSNIPVNWRREDSVHSSRLRDISAGGAFILCKDPPGIGESIEVTLRPGAALPRVSVASVVSWIDPRGAHAGFGVNFKPADASLAQQLTDVVRQHESDAFTG